MRADLLFADLSFDGLCAESFQFLRIHIAHMPFLVGLAAPRLGNGGISDVTADF
jgi:hypothetical protein